MKNNILNIQATITQEVNFKSLFRKNFIWQLLISTFLIMLATSAFAQSGNIDWNGWKFNYVAGADRSGLVLRNVSYNGKKIINKVSMPVMRVQYDGDVCGPFADILSSSTFEPARSGAPNSACNNKTLCERTFRQGGQQKLELGLNVQIAEYQIYQSYYFSPDGTMDARVFSRGLQCRVDHTHHPYWMFDFDIGDAGKDQILKNDNAVQIREFNDRKGSSRFWTIRDKATGDSVTFTPSPDDGTFDSFSKWDVAGRRYVASETGRWTAGARGEIGDLYNNNQNIDGKNVVFWYAAHLRHLNSEGARLWHASGPTIKVQGATTSPPPTTSPSPTTNRAPSVSFTSPSPANNASVSSSTQVKVKVNASDSDGSIRDVKLFVNDVLARKDSSAPYQWLSNRLLRNLSAGSYTIKAVATDNDGKATTISRTITVGGSTPTPTPTPPSSGNDLLNNGGFMGNLNGWTSCSGGAGSETHYNNSLRLDNSGCVFQEVSVSSGQSYTLTCRGRQVESGWTTAQLSFSNSSYRELAKDFKPLTTTSNTNYTMVLAAPSGTAQGVVTLYSDNLARFESCKLVKN